MLVKIPHLILFKLDWRPQTCLFQLKIVNLKELHWSPFHLVQCPLCLLPASRIALETVSLRSGFLLGSTADVRPLAVLHLVVR